MCFIHKKTFPLGFFFQLQQYLNKHLFSSKIMCSLYQINVRENRRGNHEWTIKRNWQHWEHKTQNDDKQHK